MTWLQKKMGKWEPQRSRFIAFPFFLSVEKQWDHHQPSVWLFSGHGHVGVTLKSCFFYCEWDQYTFKDAFSMENRIIYLYYFLPYLLEKCFIILDGHLS